jgi:hypothetical protein
MIFPNLNKCSEPVAEVETNADRKPHVLRMISRPTHRCGKPDGQIVGVMNLFQ